jgi:hypothetical protein
MSVTITSTRSTPCYLASAFFESTGLVSVSPATQIPLERLSEIVSVNISQDSCEETVVAKDLYVRCPVDYNAQKRM